MKLSLKGVNTLTVDAAHPGGCDPRQIYDGHCAKVVTFLIFKCGSQEDARDLAAKSFMKLVASWQPQGLGEEHAIRRLWTIVRNEYANWVRDRVRHPEQIVNWESEELGAEASDAFYLASELMSRGDMSAVIERVDTISALRTLPARQQEAVVLCHMVGYTQPEAASLMRISPESVKTHVEKGMKALRASPQLSGYQMKPINQAEVGR